MNSNNHITVDQIKNDAEVIKKELVEWRHYLHAHPELSFKEERTTHYIVNKLKNFGYTDIQIGFGPLKTGVMVEIGSGRPCVMLRADIDALPIQEQTGVEFCSQSKGVSHACGHDAHITNLLGVAKLLKKYENSIKGRVKLLFQPAEETRVKIYEKPLSGAGYVVRSGAIDDVDAIFGMHVWGMFSKGKIYVKSGPTMMASGRFNLKVIGKGTHGASPHLGCDLITTICQIVDGIQTVVSREVSPLEPRLITVGTIHGGTATNVVPQEAMISGTLRAASENVVKFMGKRLAEVAEGTAKAHRCSTEYDLLINGPAVVNDSEMVVIVREAATDVLGTERVCDVEMLTASEDFREYSARRPAALYFMGMFEPEKGVGQPQHDPGFIVNDDVLVDSVAVMTSIVFTYFNKTSENHFGQSTQTI